MMPLEKILQNVEIIPIDLDIIRNAITFQKSLDLSPQDSIVYASLLAHLTTESGELRCFITKNCKDFANPDIEDQLTAHGCKLLTKFVNGFGVYPQSVVDEYPPLSLRRGAFRQRHTRAVFHDWRTSSSLKFPGDQGRPLQRVTAGRTAPIADRTIVRIPPVNLKARPEPPALPEGNQRD